MPNSKIIPLLIAATTFCLVVFYCMRRWQPEEEVNRHQARLIAAMEDRNWKKAGKLLADDFKDNAGHDKAWWLREPREALRQFLVLTIGVKNPTTTIHYPRSETDPMTGTVVTWLHIDGSGTPIAHYVIEAANSTTAPFHFTWRKQSWKPWDWQLITVEHPLLLRTHDAY